MSEPKFFYIVVSYRPVPGRSAKVLIDGIYDDIDKANARQHQVCNGVLPTSLNNNSMYGRNGKVSWIKKVPQGDLPQLDIYTPDPS